MAEPFVIDAELKLGIPGKAASVAVGETVTGAPGTNASVENTGSENAAVLKFTIPRGDEGQAATIAVGEVVTGAAGSAASVENTGTNNAAVLKFTIPRGNTGPSGDGSGDMVAATYDPAGGARQVAFASELEGKQDKFTGTVGQTIGFNADGEAIVQDGGGLPTVSLAPIGTNIMSGTIPGVPSSGPIPTGCAIVAIPLGGRPGPSLTLNANGTSWPIKLAGSTSTTPTTPTESAWFRANVPVLLIFSGAEWICYGILPAGVLRAVQYTATLLSTGWTSANGYNVQTVTVSGLKESYSVPPDIDCALTGADASSDAAVLAGWACVSACSTGANALTAKCIGDAPTVNVPIVVRAFI